MSDVNNKLTQEQLKKVVGGVFAKASYDPLFCDTITQFEARCLTCDSYQKDTLPPSSTSNTIVTNHVCKMGRFNYRETKAGRG